VVELREAKRVPWKTFVTLERLESVSAYLDVQKSARLPHSVEELRTAAQGGSQPRCTVKSRHEPPQGAKREHLRKPEDDKDNANGSAGNAARSGPKQSVNRNETKLSAKALTPRPEVRRFCL
jgi:hypothetical protein